MQVIRKELDLFRLSEAEMLEQFRKTVTRRELPNTVLCDNDENLIDFDQSSIQSFRGPLEESFLSEIKDFNCSTSLIYKKTDLDVSSSFLQIQKPLENILASFPHYMPFKKPEIDLFESYRTKVFDVS